MAEAKRIYPTNLVTAPTQTFNLFLISEGYTTEQAFLSDCGILQEKLLALTPFNLANANSYWFAIRACYSQSTITGPRISTTTGDDDLQSGDTIFSSLFNTTDKKLYVADGDVQTFIGNITLQYLVDGVMGSHSVSEVFSTSEMSGIKTQSSVFVILTPPVVSQVAFAEMEHRGSGYHYVVTSANANFEYTVARAIAYAVGMGDEFVYAGGGAPATQADIDKVNTYPNIIHFPTSYTVGQTAVVPPTSVWYPFLDNSQRINLTVYSPSSVNFKPIGLVEGAGGYETKVYRSAPNCLMERKIGDPAASTKEKCRGFCALCTSYLQWCISGELIPTIQKKKNINSQRLVFDEQKWLTVYRKYAAVEDITTPEPAGTAKVSAASSTTYWWSFDMHVNSTDGLKFTNVKVHSAASEEFAVFKSISFTELDVLFDDDSSLTFNIDRAFNTTKKVEYVEGVLVSADSPDPLFQRGIKIIMEDDFNGRAPVTIELSITMRGGTNDFDPGGAATALKIYPQISFSWKTGGLNTVKNFTGKVVMEVDAHHEDDEESRNYASFFTDNNSVDDDTRKTDNPKPADWANLFDYYSPEVTGGGAITGVYGPGNATKWSSLRTGSYPWSGQTMKIQKVARQGQYDNIHVHGYLGNHTSPYPAINIVEAPFCPEDCFHLHWRWGLEAVSLLPIMPQAKTKFWGWSSFAHYEMGNVLPGAPLIPPNQELSVDVSNDAENKVKTIGYRIYVSDTRPYNKQVTMEQGCAFAVAIANVFLVQTAYVILLEDHDDFIALYDTIRFFEDSPYDEQIPHGTHDTTPPTTPMENL